MTGCYNYSDDELESGFICVNELEGGKVCEKCEDCGEKICTHREVGTCTKYKFDEDCTEKDMYPCHFSRRCEHRRVIVKDGKRYMRWCKVMICETHQMGRDCARCTRSNTVRYFS